MNFFLTLFAEQPAIRTTQVGLIVIAVVAIYLVFYVTRDIILRSHSFVYQVACILLAALLPIVGFFLYLLVRPAATIREREVEHMLRELTGHGKKGKDGKKGKEEE